MPTTLHSCRIENEVAPLLARQAKRKKLKLAALSSLYLREKALEEEFPGIGFRDGIGGREACVLGSRVAVWEVSDVYREAKSVAKTADHFGWPDYLVKCALAFAKAYPHHIAAQREAEVSE
ncbi:MAG: hypothetical protein HY298_05570 [Verrucomicrobia bacterium]|nr:hypothetical protein [Verrucomicrobiota bacterium]